MDRAHVVPAVAGGDVDLGLVDGAVAPTDPLPLPEATGLSPLGAGEEPLAVLLPPGHPLTGGARLGDLSEALWLDAPAAAVPLDDLRAAVGGGFPSAVRYTGGDARVLHELVRAGHGLALLPASAAGPGALPLTAPRLVHRVEIVRPPSPTPAAALFAELLGAPGDR
ncbi:LysR family transcriptional regulator substrate-binding protein [Actinacidiphila alni]|uniref:LysR family transcriptional regulator substrate-binding protein n=1 Tax=Actinacidiphila alni TaxID=380248 RepID=UPI00340BE60C